MGLLGSCIRGLFQFNGVLILRGTLLLVLAPTLVLARSSVAAEVQLPCSSGNAAGGTSASGLKPCSGTKGVIEAAITTLNEGLQKQVRDYYQGRDMAVNSVGTAEPKQRQVPVCTPFKTFFRNETEELETNGEASCGEFYQVDSRRRRGTRWHPVLFRGTSYYFWLAAPEGTSKGTRESAWLRGLFVWLMDCNRKQLIEEMGQGRFLVENAPSQMVGQVNEMTARLLGLAERASTSSVCQRGISGSSAGSSAESGSTFQSSCYLGAGQESTLTAALQLARYEITEKARLQMEQIQTQFFDPEKTSALKREVFQEKIVMKAISKVGQGGRQQAYEEALPKVLADALRGLGLPTSCTQSLPAGQS
jgi:hypothetical protein